MEFHDKKTRNFAIFNLILIVSFYLGLDLDNLKFPFLDYNSSTLNPDKLKNVFVVFYIYSGLRFLQESFEELSRKDQLADKKT